MVRWENYRGQVTLLQRSFPSKISKSYLRKGDGLNNNRMVPRIMSKIPDDTATHDSDHLALRRQQHCEAAEAASLFTAVGGRITNGDEAESWLLNTSGLSSSGTIVETVEGTERISSPRSDSAMIRLATSEAARLRLSLRASAPYKMSDIGAQRKS